MASSKAVRPFVAVSAMRLCRSSAVVVNSLVRSARSLKRTRKNSSAVLAVLKNCTAASRALPILLPMLPDVKHDADGNGYIFRGERLDLLFNVVFEDAEIV